jgi:hypothetical protein
LILSNDDASSDFRQKQGFCGQTTWLSVREIHATCVEMTQNIEVTQNGHADGKKRSGFANRDVAAYGPLLESLTQERLSN